MSVVSNGVVTLRSGNSHCEVAPRVGGAVAAFWTERNGERMHWLRPSAPTALARGDAQQMACFPMVPYVNRIRDARFVFCGREVVESVIVPGMRHAIHGHGWRREWLVADRSEDRLAIEYVHTPDAWPWSYRARQTFELSPDGLSIALDIENLSDGLMPAGLGFHPYFPRTPEATLSASVNHVWLTDAEDLPAEKVKVPPGWDLANAPRVADLVLDNGFTQWSGDAVLHWPERSARLTMSATQPLLSFLAVYCPRGGNFVCVEPASQCADAINLAREGEPDTGLRVLAPGARRGATMTLRPAFL